MATNRIPAGEAGLNPAGERELKELQEGVKNYRPALEFNDHYGPGMTTCTLTCKVVRKYELNPRSETVENQRLFAKTGEDLAKAKEFIKILADKIFKTKAPPEISVSWGQFLEGYGKPAETMGPAMRYLITVPTNKDVKEALKAYIEALKVEAKKYDIDV